MELTELEYYRCLRKLAKEFNVEIWATNVDFGFTSILEFDKDRDILKSRVFIFPDFNVFIRNYMDIFEDFKQQFGYGLCDFLRIHVKYVLVQDELINYIWRNCRELFTYGLPIRLCTYLLGHREFKKSHPKEADKFVRYAIKYLDLFITKALDLYSKFGEFTSIGDELMKVLLETGDKKFFEKAKIFYIAAIEKLSDHFKIICIWYGVLGEELQKGIFNKILNRLAIENRDRFFLTDLMNSLKYCYEKDNVCECIRRVIEVFNYHGMKDLIEFSKWICEVYEVPTTIPIINMNITYEEIYDNYSNYITLIISE